MPALPKIGSPQLIVTTHDEALNRSIINRSVALGTGLADEWLEQMKLLVRAIFGITPPNSGGKGAAGLKQGKSAINRDLFFMGFEPVEFKGHRTISMVPGGNVKGAPMVTIAPVQVKTKENPKFADPDAFHKTRLQRKSAGKRSRASRGGGQAFYVRRSRWTKMRNRLYGDIGKLLAAWIPIARRLNGGTAPAWIPAWALRHEAWGNAHGSFDVNFDPKKDKMFIRAINQTPATTDPKLIADTQRRIEAAKGYRIGAIERGLEGRAKRINAEKL
jgi:hypothetical protein